MKIIFSVYPFPLTAMRPFKATPSRGIKELKLEAGSVENPAILRIDTMFQKDYMGQELGYRDQAVMAEEIASDLVRSWSTALLGCEDGLGPGVMVAAGDHPTKQEIEAARLQQESYFRHLVEQAEVSWKDNKPHKITDYHREAARWLGQEQFEWMKQIQQVAMKDCPLCTKRIPARALVCPECKLQVAPIPDHLNFAQQAPPEIVASSSTTGERGGKQAKS